MRAHGVPSYRHHKPSGQAVVTLNGRDFYLGLWQTPESKSEYDRVIAEWIANGRMLPSISPATELTISELGLGFLRHAATYYQNDGETTSEYTCIKEAVRPLHELYSHTLVKDFGPLSLKAVRQRMIDKGWCRQHINRQINRLRRMFKWGVENELVTANILNALKAVSPLGQEKGSGLFSYVRFAVMMRWPTVAAVHDSCTLTENYDASTQAGG